MQPIRIALDINPRDVPVLVCSESSDVEEKSEYKGAISEAIAEALGVQEFLHKPERLNELRRFLWEKDQRSEL